MIDELTYRNYRYNRRRSPHIAPERWQTIYGPQWATLEDRYQKESKTNE